ncbi:MAG: histidinol-phosphate transaminase [Terriglobia bacterium]|jgi:histidinol-phosphate aminotransferase|nr:histidinol-phosphate transaminase [Terriglobia bacterium]
MGKFENLVPERVRALPAYVPGKPIKQAEAESGVKMIKLASNENPFGPSPKAVDAMQAAAEGANLYADNDNTALKNRLAEVHGLQPEQVLVTAGSTHLLDLLARTLLAPGLNAITSERSFIVYPIVTVAAGAEFRTVPMRNDAFDLDAISEAIDENTRLIFLANPNNPTGTVVDANALDAFLARIPDHVVVALDEAYCDFATDFARLRGIPYSHSLDYVKQGRNVVVLRTFSKAHGLAGVRVGYGLGPAELLGYTARLKTAFAVNSVGEAGALAAIDDSAHIKKAVENNRAGAKYITSVLRELGYQPIETWANFICCEMHEDASAVSKRLQNEGIIVRPLTGSWGWRTAIRITIGTPEQNEKLANALKRITAGTTVTK